MKKLVIGLVLPMFAVLSSCGQYNSNTSNNGDQNPVEYAKSELISEKKAADLLGQGYHGVGVNAFIKREDDGSLSFYTFGTVGEKNLLKYLKSSPEEQALMPQFVGTKGLVELGKSLEGFFRNQSETSVIPDSKLMKGQGWGCESTGITTNAGGNGSYAYANFSGPIGNIAYNCYNGRFQLDAGYPRVSNVADYYGANNCSGSLCSSSNWSVTGYNSSPNRCYSGAYISYKNEWYSPTTSLGKAYNC